MSEKDDKKSNSIWGWQPLFGLLGLVVAVLALMPLYGFSISVDPMQVDVEQNGNSFTEAEVDFRLLYYKDVVLNAEGEQPLIHVNFKPQELNHRILRNSVSTVSIFAENETPPGDYLISIVGRGSDGEEHSCKLNLKVLRKYSSSSTGTPIGTPTEVKITGPLDRALVNATESIKGTAKNVSEGNEIWIFVHPDGVNKYYPQDSSAIIQNGEWSLSVGIGSENDAGRKFEIIAVLADKEAQDEINEYFKNCTETGKWTGMDEIPVSAKESHKITVTRDTRDSKIQITYPLSTAKIQENIQGTARNIPEGQTPWLIIYPHTAYKYYPINKLDIRDEKWSCPAQFGEPKDAGTQFDIIVVLADQEAHSELTDYLETCIETKTWPGVVTLPVGTKEYARVTVKRV